MTTESTTLSDAGYQALVQISPRIGDQDRAEVESWFHLMNTLAPTLSGYPLVAATWVEVCVYRGFIDMDAIKTLLETEQLHQELNAHDAPGATPKATETQ